MNKNSGSGITRSCGTLDVFVIALKRRVERTPQLGLNALLACDHNIFVNFLE